MDGFCWWGDPLEWRRTVNAMGEIPALEEDGVRLTQTAPILLHLADRYGRYNGETAKEKFEVLCWLFWDNHKLTGYMAAYRYQRTFTPKPDPRAYQMGPDAFGLPLREIGFCASAGWDAAGAKWFGYPTFWLNRTGQAPEQLGVEADGIGAGMSDLVDFALSA